MLDWYEGITKNDFSTCILAAQAEMKERCAKLVDEMQDEQEPWMDGNDIRAIDKEK